MTAAPLVALLAAGRASRFGADKLAAPCAGAPLGSHAAEAVLATGLPAICITSAASAPDWLPPGIAAVPNPDAASGLGSSLALAARQAELRGAPALVVVLADMPCVTVDLLRRVIAAPGLAGCRYPSGRAGVPARFPATRLAQLAGLAGDRGGAVLLAGPGVTLIAGAAEELVDVDTPGGLARAEAILLARGVGRRLS